MTDQEEKVLNFDECMPIIKGLVKDLYNFFETGYIKTEHDDFMEVYT